MSRPRSGGPAEGGLRGRRSGNDDVLLRQVARGDEAAFATLYDDVADAVYGLVLRVVRDQAQSEEVTQEVLVEIWRTAARFDPARGSAKTWILAMAHRRAVDRVRTAQAAADRDDRVGRLHLPAHDDVAEAVQNRLESEQVRRALADLTDVQREVITLAYYRGLTHREVADLLGLPLGTVKTRLRDGLIRIRDAMGVQR
jgi:RNA polymerase sigma-70 factor, ECF subfamily